MFFYFAVPGELVNVNNHETHPQMHMLKLTDIHVLAFASYE